MNWEHFRFAKTLGLASLVAALLLGGCFYPRSRHRAATAVDFLYPDAREPIATQGVPVLSLPVRVGVAFVPAARRTYGSTSGLTETAKTDLLRQVAKHFDAYEFVDSIEVIPSAYLRPGGSFANLEQVQRLYNVDLIALVSYDQNQFTDQGFLSFTYWTIVGAYVVPGEKNDTHTLLDTAVFDVKSRNLLFRAPGVDHVRGRATPTNLSEQLREDSLKSFEGAVVDMIANLDVELAGFKERVRDRPEEYQVERRAGYSGGGNADWAWVALVLGLVAGLGWIRRTERRV